MNSSEIITWLIIACLVFAVLIFFSKPLRVIFRFIINAFIGCIGFVVCNFLFAFSGLTVGVNLLTVSVTGILGIPGLVVLYAVQALL